MTRPDARLAVVPGRLGKALRMRESARFKPSGPRAGFAAHFSLGEDLGDRETVLRHAVESGVDTKAMAVALDDGTAYRLVDRSEALARSVWVRGTPAWLVAGRLIPGLYPKEQFEQLAQAMATV